MLKSLLDSLFLQNNNVYELASGVKVVSNLCLLEEKPGFYGMHIFPFVLIFLSDVWIIDKVKHAKIYLKESLVAKASLNSCFVDILQWGLLRQIYCNYFYSCLIEFWSCHLPYLK